MNKFLITILGPTASGKTDLSIQLAKHFNTEIISADSRQFYNELNIGTAKPSEKELNSVPHHFINYCSVDNLLSAGKFETLALNKIQALHHQKDIAIMVGGSGLYINAVLFGIDPFPDIPASVRLKTLNFYKENGIQALRDELRKLDPEYFLEVDLDNPRRLMRALEVCYATKQPYSSFRNQTPTPRPFKSIKLDYKWERKELYERINKRVDKMMEDGLIKECQTLLDKKDLPTLDTIGYKEIFDFLQGKIEKDKAIELIKRNSRRYAKRQLTWFKKDEEIIWIEPNEPFEKIVDYIQKEILL
jgi:tRNA dimethylallyltransferase